jgi:hypothetical protein
MKRLIAFLKDLFSPDKNNVMKKIIQLLSQFNEYASDKDIGEMADDTPEYSDFSE